MARKSLLCASLEVKKKENKGDIWKERVLFLKTNISSFLGDLFILPWFLFFSANHIEIFAILMIRFSLWLINPSIHIATNIGWMQASIFQSVTACGRTSRRLSDERRRCKQTRVSQHHDHHQSNRTKRTRVFLLLILSVNLIPSSTTCLTIVVYVQKFKKKDTNLVSNFFLSSNVNHIQFIINESIDRLKFDHFLSFPFPFFVQSL